MIDSLYLVEVASENRKVRSEISIHRNCKKASTSTRYRLRDTA
jgi:hypothetical protein